MMVTRKNFEGELFFDLLISSKPADLFQDVIKCHLNINNDDADEKNDKDIYC